MKKKELLGVLLLLCVALALSGCSNTTYPQNWQSLSHVPIQNTQVEHKFDTGSFKVLGPVTVKTGGINTFLFLFSWGKNGYAELFEEARKKYGEVDTIINIMEDTHKMRILGFPDIWFLGLKETALYMKEERVITGTAIRYVR